ncbi:unnamed protein product [Coregonus sp. 'balchen']|nr:unnamed protein product [Coregonus sp. 'balchen']
MDGSHWVGVKAIAEEMGRRGHQVTVVIPEVSMRLGPSSHCRTVSYPVPYGQETVDMLMDKHKDNIRAATLPLVERMTHHMANIQSVSSFIYSAEIAVTQLSPGTRFMRVLPTPGPPQAFWEPGVWASRLCVCSEGSPVVSLVEPLLCRLLYWRFDQLANRFLGEDVGVAEVLADTALWLLRYDFTLEFPRPLMPNMVLVGGINCHIRNPLAQELEQWVSGDHGFIVFSLGSMVSGTHGLYEGVCHAVPMVMLPLFGDQPDNAQRLASKGVGVVLDIKHSSVLKLSAIHKDHPVDPLELSVYWTEFVMRHKGAGHLRAAAQDLNWFQYHSLDVIGLLIVVAMAVVMVTLKCLSLCVRRFTTRKTKQD